MGKWEAVQRQLSKWRGRGERIGLFGVHGGERTGRRGDASRLRRADPCSCVPASGMEAPEHAAPTNPSLPDDPVLKEDAAVAPALPATAYAILGVHGFGRRRGALGLRVVRALLTGVGPALVAAAGAAFLWLLAMPRSGRLAVLGERPSVDAVLTGLADMMGHTWLTVAGVAALSIPFVRGGLDAWIFGRQRDAWVRQARPVGGVMRRTLGPFVLLALVQAGLLIGGCMFLAPLVEVLLRLLVQPRPAAAATLVLGALALGIVTTLFALRFVVLVIAAHLAWRPQFVAATLATALAAPWVHWRTYLPLALTWWWWSTMVLIAASVVLASAGPSFVLAGEVSARAGFLLVLFAAAGGVAGAWLDAALVAMVGHRLGDIGTNEDVLALPEGALPQVRIVLAPPGWFDVQPADAYGASPPFRRTFDALLGYTPSVDPLASWEHGETLAAFEPLAVDRTSGGAWELVLRGPSSPHAPSDAPAAPRTFGELSQQRGTYRTAGGALEVRFRIAR